MTDLLAIFGPLTPALTAWADDINLAAAELRGALPHDVPPIEPAKLMRLAAEYLRARRLTMLSPEAQEDILQFSEEVRAYLSGHSDSPDRALEIHARIEKAPEPGDPRRRSVAALHKLLAGDAITMARVALSRAITASGGTATQALPLADLLHLGAAAIHKLMADPEGSRDLAPAEVEPGLGMAPEQDAGEAHAGIEDVCLQALRDMGYRPPMDLSLWVKEHTSLWTTLRELEGRLCSLRAAVQRGDLSVEAITDRVFDLQRSIEQKHPQKVLRPLALVPQDPEGRAIEGKAHALLFDHDEPLPATCPTCGHNNERGASPTVSCDGCGTVFTVEG